MTKKTLEAALRMARANGWTGRILELEKKLAKLEYQEHAED